MTRCFLVAVLLLAGCHQPKDEEVVDLKYLYETGQEKEFEAGLARFPVSKQGFAFPATANYYLRKYDQTKDEVNLSHLDEVVKAYSSVVSQK